MTREEAIAFFKDMNECTYGNLEAVDMAIQALEYDDAKYHEEHGEVIVDKAVWEDAKKALEQEPITKITRKYCVQDESGYTDEELVGKVNEIIDYINKEPRQDLQQAAERIIEQQNKWFEEQERKEQEPAYCDRNICLRNEYNGIGCDECEVTKSQEPSGDAVSRQAVIDVVNNPLNIRLDEIIKQLPSVNPQPTGHWIDGGEYICFGGRQKAPCICSVCRKSALNEPWYYCPNCGAKMVEPQEGE